MKFILENENIEIPDNNQDEITEEQEDQDSMLNPGSIRTLFSNSVPAIADTSIISPEIKDTSSSMPVYTDTSSVKNTGNQQNFISNIEDSSVSDYHEIADQVFNLVNNDNEKCAELKNDIQEGNFENIIQWFNSNVKANELHDLLNTESGQNPSGLIRWLMDNPDYFFKGKFKEIKTLDQLKGNSSDNSSDTSKGVSNKEAINKVNHADDQILSIENESSEDDAESSENGNIPVDGKQIMHKRHLLNKVIITINNDDAADYQIYEKYYILKNTELGSIDKLDKIENTLDKKKISYYDFTNGSCKIYDSNEVELNRIFESQDLDVRCKDIRKYTENEISSNKIKAANTRTKKKLQKQEDKAENKTKKNKPNTAFSSSQSTSHPSKHEKNKNNQTIIYMTDSTFENYVRKLQKTQLWYRAPKITVSVTNTLEERECHVNVTVRKKEKIKDSESFSTSFKRDDEIEDAEKVLTEFIHKMNASNFSLENN